MTSEEQTHNNPRANMNVLLVIIGGLGDWCIRRVLKHAIEFEKKSDHKVTVVVIDVHPLKVSWLRDSFDKWMDAVDRWIVRRLIEQTAEDVDQPLRDAAGNAIKEPDWGFTGRLATNPKLPDPTESGGPDPDAAVTDFTRSLGSVFQGAYDKNREALLKEVATRLAPYLAKTEEEFLSRPARTLSELAKRWDFSESVSTFPEISAEILRFVSDQVMRVTRNARQRLTADRTSIKEWLREATVLAERKVHRYWRSDPAKNKLFQCSIDGDKVEVDDAMLRRLASEYRIIVYAATPPDAYARVLKQWSAYAERIALEKPIAGLLETVD